MKKLMRNAALSALVAFSSAGNALANDDMARKSSPSMEANNYSFHELYAYNYFLHLTRAIDQHLKKQGGKLTSTSYRSLFMTVPFMPWLHERAFQDTETSMVENFGHEVWKKHSVVCEGPVRQEVKDLFEESIKKYMGYNPYNYNDFPTVVEKSFELNVPLQLILQHLEFENEKAGLTQGRLACNKGLNKDPQLHARVQ